MLANIFALPLWIVQRLIFFHLNSTKCNVSLDCALKNIWLSDKCTKYLWMTLCPYSFVAVKGNRVEVSLPGHSLVRCELSAEAWELLWELRTSIQTMLYRTLSNPSSAVTNSAQDRKLISLLVELLNNTNLNPFENQNSDSEVDWWYRPLSKCACWISWLVQRNQKRWWYLMYIVRFCIFKVAISYDMYIKISA